MAYARAHGLIKAKGDLTEGRMAAVGLSKDEILDQLPEGIVVGCQNSSGSVTISGPVKETLAFVKELNSKGIFAKIVETGKLAFHSKYIYPACSYLSDFLKKILTDPKPRSTKWISSSVPSEKSSEIWTQYNSPEYHLNNFRGTVLFDQVFQHIPKNALVVEIAPHGLLQAILKRELGPNAICLSALDKTASDNEQFLLSTIGK